MRTSSLLFIFISISSSPSASCHDSLNSQPIYQEQKLLFVLCSNFRIAMFVFLEGMLLCVQWRPKPKWTSSMNSAGKLNGPFPRSRQSRGNAMKSRNQKFCVASCPSQNMSVLLLSNFLLNFISISLSIILPTLNWKVSKVSHYLSFHNNS